MNKKTLIIMFSIILLAVTCAAIYMYQDQSMRTGSCTTSTLSQDSVLGKKGDVVETCP